MLNDYEFPTSYEIIRSIGSGSFADVYLGKHKLTGENVAIKIINKKILKSSDSMQSVSDEYSKKMDESEELQINHKFKKEITIMEAIKPQPFIIQLFNFTETTNYYHIIIEYGINGNLAQQLMMYKDRLKENENKRDIKIENRNIIDFSDENEIKKVFVQIIRTVIYLHENCRIAHRDLKAENIILDENMNIKIIDFGLGCKIVKNENVINDQDNSNVSTNDKQMAGNTFKKQWILDDQSTCGPPNYVPPEMILRNALFGEEVDTWMLGVLLYFIVYDIFPYHSHDIKNLISKIAYLDYSVPKKRMVVKEYVKTIKSKSKSSISAQTDSDDDDDEEFNFLKQDLFTTYPKKKKKPHKKTKKSSKNHFLMGEINFYGSGSNFMSSSSSDNDDDNNFTPAKDNDKKVVKFKEIEVDVSDSCRDLITKMLCKDPNKRIPLRDVLKHRWILEAKEFVSENENLFSNPEKNVNLPLEQELEQNRMQRSLRAAKLATFFAEKSDSELFEMKNLSAKAVVESFFKKGEIPFDLARTEEQLKNNVYNENTEMLRILLKREERLQFKKLVDDYLEEK